MANLRLTRRAALGLLAAPALAADANEINRVTTLKAADVVESRSARGELRAVAVAAEKVLFQIQPKIRERSRAVVGVCDGFPTDELVRFIVKLDLHLVVGLLLPVVGAGESDCRAVIVGSGKVERRENVDLSARTHFSVSQSSEFAL